MNQHATPPVGTKIVGPSSSTGASAMILSPWGVYIWTDAVLRALRQALLSHGFTEILPAILSERYEPGARHSIAVLGDRSLPAISQSTANRSVTVAGGEHYYLPVSHCVEKCLSLEHLDRAYCITPCVRLLMEGENRSNRHLSTFFQLELEWRTESVNEVHGLIERIIALFATELLRSPTIADWLDEEAITRIRALSAIPYERIQFKHARGAVADAGGTTNPHSAGDLTHSEESDLSKSRLAPFWLTEYPDGVRDSLYHRTPDGISASYDLILPAGFGEVATGGLRPKSGAEILRQSHSLGSSVHPFYAEWKERTKVQTGGLGFGLERLIRYCTGVQSILDLRQAHDQGPNRRIRDKS
jgi:asparaginyl-tRNA synthetase